MHISRNLKDTVQLLRGKKIIVWGDFILDEYIYTTTSRISREAPVLVTEFESNDYILGGAGNVVMNIKALGAIPIPVGVIGKNNDGEILKKLLRDSGIETKHLVQLEGYRTPKKSRILSGGENTKKQQVMRIDRLNKSEINTKAYDNTLLQLEQLLKDQEHTYLILSDYIFKSVVPEVFQKLKQKFPHINYILDSRQHLRSFPGVTIATPNEPEIRNLFPDKHFYKDEEFLEVGAQLLEKLQARGIVLKRGHKGMIVFRKDKDPQTLDIHGSSNIVDVTGAGDTVISVISLALAAGADLVEAAKLASIAAGFVVMKEGAYAISYQELEHELEQIL